MIFLYIRRRKSTTHCMTYSSQHKGNRLHKSGKGLYECWMN
ncbi:MAG: hypothetical protein PHP99_06330 [Paludibacter sp.]|nr:hypothetical protein [Paludibacter sp.]MDX9919899.1 hypothetical protein [Paludibacter sp.]